MLMLDPVPMVFELCRCHQQLSTSKQQLQENNNWDVPDELAMGLLKCHAVIESIVKPLVYGAICTNSSVLLHLQPGPPLLARSMKIEGSPPSKPHGSESMSCMSCVINLLLP